MTYPLSRALVDIHRQQLVRGRRDGLGLVKLDGTGPEYAGVAEQLRAASSYAAITGALTWRHLLSEDFYTVLAQTEPRPLRTELVRLGAVVTAWIESLDARPVKPSDESAG